MMFNLTMFALGFLSAFPKPDLASVDIGTFQIGGGVILNFPTEYEIHLLLPDIGLSLGQARTYYGKKLAFLAGLELFRGELAYAPSDRTALFGTMELFMPEIGISFFLGPARELKPQGGIAFSQYRNFQPNVDIAVGFCPVNPVLARQPFDLSPTIRTEARLRLSRSFQILFENRNIWADRDILTFNTCGLSLCFSFGNDFLMDKGGER